MKLSLQRMQFLVPDGRLAEGIFKSITAQVKTSNQGLIFDTDLIQEETIRTYAVEIAQEFPDVVASEAEIEEAVRITADQEAGLARYKTWLTGQNGKRLLGSPKNERTIIRWIETHGNRLSVEMVDRAIAVCDVELDWAEPPPPPAPPPPPPPRKLPNGEIELPLDTPDWQLSRFSVTQIRDLDARRNPNRQAPSYGFEPLPAEINRKAVVNASAQLLRQWEKRFGRDALDARLQGRG